MQADALSAKTLQPEQTARKKDGNRHLSVGEASKHPTRYPSPSPSYMGWFGLFSSSVGFCMASIYFLKFLV